MNQRTLIFCQAPIEVPNVADLYVKIKDTYRDIVIVSLGTDSYSKFFQYHKFDASYITLKGISPYTRKWVFGWKRQLKEDLEKLQLVNSDIYFTSKFDPRLAIYLKHATPSCNLYYRFDKDRIWKKYPSPKLNLSTWFNYYLFKIITQVPVVLFPISVNGAIYEIDFNKIKTTTEEWHDDGSTIKRLSYKPQTKNAAILFTEPYRNRFQLKENYDQLNLQIVDNLQKKGFYVVMKGHPRLGNHPLLMGKVDAVIPEFIPSEFIDITRFSLAIGFVSTALCDAAKYIPTYSVLDICDIQDDKGYRYWKDFLASFNVNITFMHNFDEIK